MLGGPVARMAFATSVSSSFAARATGGSATCVETPSEDGVTDGGAPAKDGTIDGGRPTDDDTSAVGMSTDDGMTAVGTAGDGDTGGAEIPTDGCSVARDATAVEVGSMSGSAILTDTRRRLGTISFFEKKSNGCILRLLRINEELYKGMRQVGEEKNTCAHCSGSSKARNYVGSE